jgi:hypothetical protein
MVDAFEMWMMTLDPLKVAEESFHGVKHREAMALHDAEKVRILAGQSRVVAHEMFLARVAESWALKESRDTPMVGVVTPHLSVKADMNTTKKEPVFTPEQLRIAQAVQDRKAS